VASLHLDERPKVGNNITMVTPIIPDPDTVLAELTELRPLIYEALEVGTQAGRDHFAATGAPFDPWLFAHLTRFYAKQHLIRNGYPIDDEDRHSLEQVAYSGLWLRFQAKDRIYQIRILKSALGDLPSPGSSKVKQNYYQQLPVGLTLRPEQEQLAVNLIVLWDVNGLHNLTDLSLVCPKDGDESYWFVPIPHPALSIPSQAMPAVDLDLPIERKETEEKDDDAKKTAAGTE